MSETLTLDDLQRLETVKGGIRGVEPGGDRVGLDELGEPGLKTLGFAHAAEAWFVGCAAALPVRDDSFRESGQTREHLAAQAELMPTRKCQ